MIKKGLWLLKADSGCFVAIRVENGQGATSRLSKLRQAVVDRKSVCVVCGSRSFSSLEPQG